MSFFNRKQPQDPLEWQVQTLQGALEGLDTAIVDLEAQREGAIAIDQGMFLAATAELAARKAERPALVAQLEEAQKLLAAQREETRRKCSTEELTRWRSSTWEPMLAAVAEERQRRIAAVEVAGEKLRAAVERLESHPAEAREIESQTRGLLHELEQRHGDLGPALLAVPLPRPPEIDLTEREREAAFTQTRQWLRGLQPAPVPPLVIYRDPATVT